MWKLDRNTPAPANSWQGETRQPRVQGTAVRYENTAQVVLREIGVILAIALGIALTVNLALIVLHVG